MTSPVQVQFAIDDADKALAIVDQLLEARLISCGQRLGPVTSQYHWEGAVELTEEWLVLCKTTRGRLDEVVAAIAAAHPYETPEIIATDVVGGLGDYLSWNEAETSPDTV